MDKGVQGVQLLHSYLMLVLGQKSGHSQGEVYCDCSTGIWTITTVFFIPCHGVAVSEGYMDDSNSKVSNEDSLWSQVVYLALVCVCELGV